MRNRAGLKRAARLPRRSLRPATRPIVVGVDTGGTFTDLVAFVDGEVHTHKVPSTPADPAAAVLLGLHELLPLGHTAILTYASTVATNALLERRGARVVLLTTQGFEDVIEIARQNRPQLYALEPQHPQPLVPRACRVGVDERMLFDGQVLTPLTAANVKAALRKVQRLRPEAVAICFLHSYANAAHERRMGEALAALPAVFVSLSYELVPEMREYERTSTTVINAYVGPVMDRHLRALGEGLDGHMLRVMQSNGGSISAAVAGSQAVRTLLSGPAAGVTGALTVARSLGLERVLTFDMGGTSTDVSLLDGQARQCATWEVGGLPLKVPAIDIHTVGAGGGSIAFIDAGGALKVGPRSAGANPGPACYGRGVEATVTDANLVLGRLVPQGFLGGRMALSVERSQAALAQVGRRLRLEAAEVAEGVTRIANASMERAIRRISVERGHAPREYSLLVFGGAGGQHACELAMALGIRHIVVPCHPGLLSAWGAAAADERRDFVHSLRQRMPSTKLLRDVFAELGDRARREAGGVGFREERSLDLRYSGQGHELNVAFGRTWLASFHAMHVSEFGYCDEQREVEVVNLRLSLVRRGPRVPQRLRAQPMPALAQVQPVRWQGAWQQARVYDRACLRPRQVLRGPALVCELSATTFVAPGWSLRVHATTRHLELQHAR